MRKLILVEFLVGMATFVTMAVAQTNDVEQLGHGINLGNMLESPREGAWGASVHAEYFPIIRQAGFTVIRVPICWSAHVGPGPGYMIDPAFLNRVDWVVDEARRNDLKVILDYHNDDALMASPAANEERFLVTWKQIAEHYQTEPLGVVFELLNEPNGNLDAERWNQLLRRALNVIRATNPARTVVVGPVRWNSIGALSKLDLPERDRHLLVTIHFYDPMTFTHQGASWIGGSDKWLGTSWGTDAEQAAVAKSFDEVAKWGAGHLRPMFLGEFGAFSRGDMPARARWTACVARAAESHGIPWTYWEFCSGFGVFDPVAMTWRQPLLEALLPRR